MVCMYHNFFFHSSANGHVGCFRVLAVINSATINIGVHVAFSFMVFSEYMSRRRITGSFGSFIPCCFFLRNLDTVLQSGYINLHSHQQCKKIPFFSTPSPTFIVCRFFDDGHSDWCELLTHCSFDLHFSDIECC